MYKATISFAMDNLRTYKQGEILAEDFTTQDEITDLLEAGYIIEYDGSLEITENGTYDVTEYETAEVNVGGGGSTAEIHNMAYLFYNGNRVEDITNVLKLCRNVTKFSQAFYSASNMTSVSLNGVTAGENVTASDSIFSGCTTLVTADLTNFITTSFKDLTGMFYRCFKLKNVNFAGCDFSKVTIFNNMFYYCQELESIDLSMIENGNTYVQVNAMFSHCTSMKHIDLRNFNFNIASFGSSMFDNTFPTDCEIIVKDTTQKQWFTTYYPSFTNVKTVDEL